MDREIGIKLSEKRYKALVEQVKCSKKCLTDYLVDLIKRDKPRRIKSYVDEIGDRDAFGGTGYERIRVYCCPACDEELDIESEPGYCPCCGQSLYSIEDDYD